MRDSRRTYAANPSTETGGNSKKGTNVLTEIYKFSATLHPHLRRPSFLTDNVQMLPIFDSSFSTSSTHSLSETGLSRIWVDRCAGCFHHELSSLICFEQRMSPSSISKLHHTQITGCRAIHNNPSVYPRAFADSLHSLLEFVQDCNVVEFLEFSPILAPCT